MRVARSPPILLRPQRQRSVVTNDFEAAASGWMRKRRERGKDVPRGSRFSIRPDDGYPIERNRRACCRVVRLREAYWPVGGSIECGLLLAPLWLRTTEQEPKNADVTE